VASALERLHPVARARSWWRVSPGDSPRAAREPPSAACFRPPPLRSSRRRRGPSSYWKVRIPPADLERAHAAGQQSLCEGSLFQIEYRILRADTGEERWLRSNGSIIPASAGQGRRFVGISFDITDRKRAEVQQQLLIDEINHRVKNTLGIVQSIARQSIKQESSVSENIEAFEGRLAALSTVHNLLTSGLWQATVLSDLISGSLTPLARKEQIHAEGQRVMLGTKTAVTMALALHELATNALKYGALSVPEGHVHISWTRSDLGKLQLSWVERGGPKVQVPEKRGFGLRMIEKGMAADLRGSVEVIFDTDGLIFRLEAQLPERDG